MHPSGCLQACSLNVLSSKPNHNRKFNFHLNLYLQKQGYHPRYKDGSLFYYSKSKEIEKEIKIYSILEKESEVSEFGKNL